MADQRTEIDLSGLVRLQSAVSDYAKIEVSRLTDVLVAKLKARPVIGLFGDVAARHLWDEYRWNLQEGPFDDVSYIDGLSTGSTSGNLDDLIEALLREVVENLPPYAQIFLTSHARAYAEDEFDDALEAIGSISIDIIVDLMVDEIRQQGCVGNLNLIGPDRADTIVYELVPLGMVWSTLADRNEASEIISEFTDEILDPDGDLSQLVEEMVEAFFTSAGQDESDVLFALLAYHEDELRTLAVAGALSSLEEARADLHAQIDK